MGQRKTRLIVIPGNLNAQPYVIEVLYTEVIQYLRRHGLGTLQQDNAHPRTAGLTTNNIGVLIGLHCPRNKLNIFGMNSGGE